jgi:thiosulfate dehydrogenase (quinone) large subunit
MLGGGSMVSAQRPDPLKRCQVGRRILGRHCLPQVAPETNDQVDAAGSNCRCPQAAQRGGRPGHVDVRTQVELDELVGTGPLRKNAELRDVHESATVPRDVAGGKGLDQGFPRTLTTDMVVTKLVGNCVGGGLRIATEHGPEHCMPRRRTTTLEPGNDPRNGARADSSPKIPDQDSVLARVRTSLIRELRHPAVFMFPLRLFIGIGWLRAFGEKVISADWFDGQAVGSFLDSKTASGAVAFPVYEQLMESVLRPGSRWIGWLIMVLQLVVGLAVITGTYTNLALLIGSAMNVNFILAGQLNPSAFYIVIQTVLFVTGAGAIVGSDGNRARRPDKAPSILLVAHPDVRRTSNADKMAVTGLAAFAGALSWTGFAHTTDFSPSGIGDPALVLGTVMGLGALSLIILRFRMSALDRSKGPRT